MRIYFCVILLLTFSGVTLASPDLNMVVVGKKEQVLAVLHKSFETEFSDSRITAIKMRVGYETQFDGFFTGLTNISAALNPLSKNDEMEVTAFQIDFGWETELFTGTSHIRALKEQIAKQAALLGKVYVTSDSKSYIPFINQVDECFNKLQNDNELNLISKKLALSSVASTTLIMLADESKVTEQEKPIIIRWTEKRDKYHEAQNIYIYLSTLSTLQFL